MRSGRGISRGGTETVMICGVPEPWCSRIVQRLSPAPGVHVVKGFAAVSNAVSNSAISLALVGLDAMALPVNNGGIPARVDTLLDDLQQTPSVGIYCEHTTLPTALVVHLIKGGFVDIVPLHNAANLQRVVAGVFAQLAAGLYVPVWDAVSEYVAPEHARLVKMALRHAHVPFTVDTLAKALRCTDRTLRRHCATLGDGSTLWLKAMSRLLIAGYLLDQPAAVIDKVAERLGFDSTQALRDKLVRWTGRTTATLQHDGWIATLGPMLRRRSTR